jgi:hypothetical protein
MLFSNKTRNRLLIAFAILSVAAGLYHFAGLFYKIDQAPVWRHAIFIGISFFCIYGIIKRPVFFIYFIALLLVQQYYSHGYYLIQLWVSKKQVHWISVADLLLLPILLICLVEDCKIKSSNTLD